MIGGERKRKRSERERDIRALLHKRSEGGLEGELCQPRAPGCTRAKGLHLSIVFECVLCMYCKNTVRIQ